MVDSASEEVGVCELVCRTDNVFNGVFEFNGVVVIVLYKLCELLILGEGLSENNGELDWVLIELCEIDGLGVFVSVCFADELEESDGLTVVDSDMNEDEDTNTEGDTVSVPTYEYVDCGVLVTISLVLTVAVID